MQIFCCVLISIMQQLLKGFYLPHPSLFSLLLPRHLSVKWETVLSVWLISTHHESFLLKGQTVHILRETSAASPHLWCRKEVLGEERQRYSERGLTFSEPFTPSPFCVAVNNAHRFIIYRNRAHIILCHWFWWGILLKKRQWCDMMPDFLSAFKSEQLLELHLEMAIHCCSSS